MKYFLDKYLLKYEVHTCYLDLDLDLEAVEVPTYMYSSLDDPVSMHVLKILILMIRPALINW